MRRGADSPPSTRATQPMTQITAQPLTKAAFAPYGDVLDISGDPDKTINAGFCGRFHDRATMDFGPEGRAGISLFDAVPREMPYTCDLIERHPEGSQAFIPMHENEWLVIVATQPTPQDIRAFVVPPHTGINLHRGTWHGVLTPLHAPGLFAVVDRIGTTSNLEEFALDEPVIVHRP